MSSRYRHRAPRDYDDESDTSPRDDYPPPRPRQSTRRPQQVRRPSILVDPDETLSQRAHRRQRANSNVQLQTSDDEDVDPRDVRARRAPPREPRHDMEAKNTEGHRRFRAKRDGYESDEAQRLRDSRAPPPPRGYDDVPDDYGRPRRSNGELPIRSKPPPPREPVDNIEYGGGAPPPPPPEPKISRRRTYKEPSARDRQGYDDYDGSPRYQERRKPTNYDDPGYRSDHARRPPRREPRPRKEYDDYDDYERPRRRREDVDAGYRSGGERRRPPPRAEDYYSDYREDRAPRRGDPRRYPDDRRRDYDYDRRRRDVPPGAGKKQNWQKEAGAAFVTYAMPVIQKEGTRFVKKELAKFLAKQGGA